jgi:hypothetical protein
MWDGNYYALSVTERLGLEGKGGMVRIGAVPYNTVEEIRQLWDALREMKAEFGLHIQLKLDRFKEFSLQAGVIQFPEILFESAFVEGPNLITQSNRIHA